MPTWWYLWDELRNAIENFLARHSFYLGWYNQFVDEDTAHTLPKGESHIVDFDGDCPCKPELEPIVRENGSFGWLYKHRQGKR